MIPTPVISSATVAASSKIMFFALRGFVGVVVGWLSMLGQQD